MRAWQNAVPGRRFWVSKAVLLKAAKSRKIPGPVPPVDDAGFTRPGTGFSKPPFEKAKPPIGFPIPGTEFPIGGVVADSAPRRRPAGRPFARKQGRGQFAAEQPPKPPRNPQKPR